MFYILKVKPLNDFEIKTTHQSDISVKRMIKKYAEDFYLDYDVVESDLFYTGFYGDGNYEFTLNVYNDIIDDEEDFCVIS